ncbi:MAG: acylphosphatase [Candidatus Pacearchaeota archaeon]|jgi:acylphosphatase
MKKSIRLYISGKIQAVFLRGFIKENAEKLNVKGFVRNLDDGRVEVFLEGNPPEVNKMIEICQKGIKNSEITNVEMKQEKFQDFKNFKVLHI